MNFQVAITEMYPQILLELVTNPLASMHHTLGTTALGICSGDVWFESWWALVYPILDFT